MTQILLIQPPIRDFYFTAKRSMPYGLSCIAAALMDKGFSVEIFDSLASSKSKPLPLPQSFSFLKAFYGKPDLSAFNLFHQYKHFGYSFQHMEQIVKQKKPFLVGIAALFTAYSEQALMTAETVKKAYPQCITVIGGHHPTAMPEKVIENPFVDFVIRGEGEVAMPLLARALTTHGHEQNKALEAIPGLVYYDRRNMLHIRKPALAENLNAFPLPAIDLINNRYYRRNKRGSTVIVTSRGCPMTCSYCCVGGSVPGYRKRDLSFVLAEIDRAIRLYNAAFIDFEDENLSLDRKWFVSLLQEITTRFDKFKPELRAMNGLFPASLDEEVIILMKKAGFRTLNLSVGSISKAQLKRFSRPDVTTSLEKVLFWAKKHHLETVCYIIAGAPGQKPEDSLSDLLFFLEKNVIVGVSIFYPAPGSKDYDRCSVLGLLPRDFSLMRSSALPVSHTTTRLEAVTLLRLGRIQNFIKALSDKGFSTPGPAPVSKKDITDPFDRMQTGKTLLSWFLYDGIIRGVTGEKEIYAHNIDLTLSRKYLEMAKTVIG